MTAKSQNDRAISIFDLDDTMLNMIRGQPHRLLREQRIPREVSSLGPLLLPPRDLAKFPALIGTLGNTRGAPTTVVTGICQGRGRRVQNRAWQSMGPTLECMIGLDTARAIARIYPGCALEIWVADQEYANIVTADGFDSDPKSELRLGEMLAAWCKVRYPEAIVRRTSTNRVREQIYSLVADGTLASLYHNGVPAPFGATGDALWLQFQFLASVAAFAHTAVSTNAPTWAIADHEQLRVLSAAHSITGQCFGGLIAWPCARLRWNAPQARNGEHATRYAERLLYNLKNQDRRMYRASDIRDMLFIGMPKKKMLEHLTAEIGGERPRAETLFELMRFADVPLPYDDMSVSTVADRLHAVLEQAAHEWQLATQDSTP